MIFCLYFNEFPILANTVAFYRLLGCIIILLKRERGKLPAFSKNTKHKNTASQGHTNGYLKQPNTQRNSVSQEKIEPMKIPVHKLQETLRMYVENPPTEFKPIFENI